MLAQPNLLGPGLQDLTWDASPPEVLELLLAPVCVGSLQAILFFRAPLRPNTLAVIMALLVLAISVVTAVQVPVDRFCLTNG